jgi:hypothetical protein
MPNRPTQNHIHARFPTMADPENLAPHTLICPLSHETMIDPVVTPSGHTYERAAIERWLDTSPTSPVTRAPLTPAQLVSNRALRDILEARAGSGGVGTGGGAQMEPALPATAEDVQLEVDVGGFVRSEEDTERATSVVSVRVPEGSRRVPVHVALVIDVSGSMDAECEIITEEAGERERSGLNVLDICKHSAKTLLHMLGPGDMFSLVSFSNIASVVVNRARIGVEPGARRAAIAAVEGLRAGGGTNLWDGLVKGLELANDGAAGVSSSVMLLTDGVPNIEPPRGHLPMLQRWIDKNGLRCSVSTFGFGYSLKSALLGKIARACGGSFGFIPNAQLVGTVFVHFLANLLSTCAHSKLSLEAGCGAKLDGDSLHVGYDAQLTSWGVVVDLGPVQLGQSRDIPVSVRLPDNKSTLAHLSGPLITATLSYTCLSGTEDEAAGEAAMLSGEDTILSEEELARRNWHVARLRLVDCLGQVVENGASEFETSRQAVRQIVAELQALSPLGEEGKALLKDVVGQVAEAVSREDWFARWGLHYYCSLRLSHLSQMCCNFKDPGLQNYGGKVFKELRDCADDVFLGLPMPTPSIRESPVMGMSTFSMPHVRAAYSPSMRRPRAAAPTSRQFYNRDNPCLDGSVLVRIAGGDLVEARALRKGMAVETLAFEGAGSKPRESSSEIVCVVKTTLGGSVSPMVRMSTTGGAFTPYHPLYFRGEWLFPREVGPISLERPTEIFSFVLQTSRHALALAGDVAAAALAHEISGPVIEHPYLGSPRVADDLRKFPGWTTGLIQIPSGSMMRNEQGFLCGFRLDTLSG